MTIPAEERDPLLREKLAAEAPGILNWMLAGFLNWQKNGMREPPAVTAATQTYREESDPLGDFLRDCCLISGSYIARSAQTYRVYETWAREQGLREPEAMSLTKFGRLMGDRFKGDHDNRGKFYMGVGLREGAEIVTGLGAETVPGDNGAGEPEASVTGLNGSFESESDGFQENPVEPDSLSSRGAYTDLPVNPSQAITESEGSATKELRL